ncbi:sensor histidine kinase [Streptomyces sp. SID5785]|uniref:sensor histidine kinase n=1 Tax=Streptomyces sp. SID5785 TaxID=2690309 RepID=UPI0013611914|nr:sensor histidine kinase [Streptomyces sp. SID5785]MZD07576.1 sensor histidine kinase [Streptomyces sp. SID5785]
MSKTTGSRGAAAWCGLALYPVVLTLPLFGSASTLPLLRALGVTLCAVLLVGVARRMPLLALAVLLVGTLAATAAQPGSVHPSPAGGLPASGFPDGVDGRGTTLLAFLAADLVLGLLVARRPRRQWVAGVLLSLVAQGAGIAGFASPENQVALLVIALLAVLVSCMAGLVARERSEHADALRDRAVSEAVTAERLHIARELHDMVSHGIGVITMQSGVAARVVETRPAEARAALEAIEQTGRETLRGLRRALVALRRADSEADAPLAPATGLADLDALVERAAGEGVRVDLERTGAEAALPSDVDRSAYRIVQEALANVVRHAGVATCRVTVRRAERDLFLEIVDAGRGAGARSSGAGFGITGMGERVRLLHGEFSAGPRPEGGFRVAARIPLPLPGEPA